MVAIWEKPEMSDFEKGVAHGMSLAKAEEAVVGDWEDRFSKLYKTLGYKDNLSFEEIPPDIQLKQFITTLLAAKDREREDAYKKGFIDGGLSKS